MARNGVALPSPPFLPLLTSFPFRMARGRSGRPVPEAAEAGPPAVDRPNTGKGQT